MAGGTLRVQGSRKRNSALLFKTPLLTLQKFRFSISQWAKSLCFIRITAIKVIHMQLQSKRNSSLLASLKYFLTQNRETTHWMFLSGESFNKASKISPAIPRRYHLPQPWRAQVLNYYLELRTFCHFYMEVSHCRLAVYHDFHVAYSNLCTAYSAGYTEIYGLGEG